MKYAIKLRSLYINFLNIYKSRDRINFIREFRNKYLYGRPLGNVVIVTVDCLRYRNLSFTGYNRKTTPFLDSFKVKLKAIASSPHTYSSVPSIISGYYPHNHGAMIAGRVRNMDTPKNFRVIKKDIVLLPEVMRIMGYNTLFLSTIFPSILPFKGSMINIKDMGKVPASRVLNEALHYIEKIVNKGKNFFAYIHLGDLHEPIDPPKEFIDFFGKVLPLPNIKRWDYRRPDEQKGKKFNDYRFNRILLYDNTLRYLDYALKNFIINLKQITNDPLLIIITADHGEEFWEHAELEAKYFYDPRGFYGVGHGHNVFNEIIEVPFLLNEFNSKKLKSIPSKKPVSSVDIVPTILQWLGLEFNSKLFDGYSIFNSEQVNRWILSESVAYGYEKKAFIKENYKLIYSEGDKIAWVFDLNKDYLEQNPITDKEIVSHITRELKKILVEDMIRRSKVR